VFGRWLTLVRSLVGSQRIGEHRVPFGPTDEVVVKAALQHLTGYTNANTRLAETTIPNCGSSSTPPRRPRDAVPLRIVRQFLDETRLLRDALGQLVSGALAGLFDDHTSITVDWAAPIQSLSLSRLEALGDEAVGIALTCLNSWGRGMRELAPRGDMRIVVRDESWKQLRLGPEASKSFDADLRLSRRDGDIQFAVAHKPSDLLSAGGRRIAGHRDRERPVAPGRHQDPPRPRPRRRCRTRTPPRPGPDRAEPGHRWAMQGKGRALWCVGDQHYKVQTILHPANCPSPTPTKPSTGQLRSSHEY